MQNAQSLFARFPALAAALLVSVSLAGCGGGQAAAPDRVGLDFADEQNQPHVELSGNILESYGSEGLLRGNASNYGHGTFTPAELSALLDSHDSAAAAQ
jgi:hypothetical protein